MYELFSKKGGLLSDISDLEEIENLIIAGLARGIISNAGLYGKTRCNIICM